MTKNLEKYQLEVLENIKQGVEDTFIYLKTLKKHSLLLRTSTNVIYCVLGITDPIEELVPSSFAVVETAILNFGDGIICDGLISHYSVTIGPNMRKDVRAQYIRAKNSNQLIYHITIGSTRQGEQRR